VLQAANAVALRFLVRMVRNMLWGTMAARRGLFGGRWNPLHQMLATGTDALAGKYDVIPGLRYADERPTWPLEPLASDGILVIGALS
jgi:hypothetical protein